MTSKRKKAKKPKEQAMFASSVPGEYIVYIETRPGHFVANILTDEHGYRNGKVAGED